MIEIVPINLEDGPTDEVKDAVIEDEEVEAEAIIEVGKSDEAAEEEVKDENTEDE